MASMRGHWRTTWYNSNIFNIGNNINNNNCYYNRCVVFFPFKFQPENIFLEKESHSTNKLTPKIRSKEESSISFDRAKRKYYSAVKPFPICCIFDSRRKFYFIPNSNLIWFFAGSCEQFCRSNILHRDISKIVWNIVPM